MLIGMCTDPEERGEGRAKIPGKKRKDRDKGKKERKGKREEVACAQTPERTVAIR